MYIRYRHNHVIGLMFVVHNGIFMGDIFISVGSKLYFVVTEYQQELQ